MNTWCGIGNLTKDPVASTNKNGDDVCKFTIAVNRGKKDENGSQLADFINVRATSQKAALCREYLLKGRKVGVRGPIRTYSFKDENGNYVSGWYVALDEITFLYNGDPNKGNLGDVHADDGVVHPEEPQGLHFSTEPFPADPDELPF